MEHSKSDTAFFYEIAVIFSSVYLSDVTCVIRAIHLMTESIPDAIIIL